MILWVKLINGFGFEKKNMKKINLNNDGYVILSPGETVLFYDYEENYFLCMIENVDIKNFSYDINTMKTKGYEDLKLLRNSVTMSYSNGDKDVKWWFVRKK